MSAYPPSNGIAAALRDWRERQRVSQLELALRAGTTQRHVSFIERGRSLPGRAMVVRLAEALEVPLRERNTLLLTAGYAPAYARELVTTLTHFATAVDVTISELTLEAFLPGDAETAAYFTSGSG